MTWFRSHEHITNGYCGFENLYPLLNRGIFLDTAPLFILICGHYDKNKGTHLIERFNAKIMKDNKDADYKTYDYNYLLAFLNSLNKNKIPLFITPHVFTEFIRHLSEIIGNPEQFREVINFSFKSKKQIKDKLHNAFCDCFFEENDFLDKKLQVGDVSIIICIKEEKKNNGAVTILTDDKTFAEISDKKHGFITIYYDEIRTATYQLGNRNIPKCYLRE